MLKMIDAGFSDTNKYYNHPQVTNRIKEVNNNFSMISCLSFSPIALSVSLADLFFAGHGFHVAKYRVPLAELPRRARSF